MNAGVIKSVYDAAIIFLKQNSPSILTGFGVAGCISTAILTAKSTIAAYKKYEENPELKTAGVKEQAKEILPLYIVPTVTGLFTLACIVGANHINLKRNAALASAYLMSSNDLKEYKAKVEEKIGKKKSQDIKDEIAKDKILKNPPMESYIYDTEKGKTLCYDVLSGRYFKCDIEMIRKAENLINYELNQGLPQTVNDLYYNIGLPGIGIGNNIGWDIKYDSLLTIDYSSQLTENDEPCLVLSYIYSPLVMGGWSEV